jgi:hypothetical protein
MSHERLFSHAQTAAFLSRLNHRSSLPRNAWISFSLSTFSSFGSPAQIELKKHHYILRWTFVYRFSSSSSFLASMAKGTFALPFFVPRFS